MIAIPLTKTCVHTSFCPNHAWWFSDRPGDRKFRCIFGLRCSSIIALFQKKKMDKKPMVWRQRSRRMASSSPWFHIWLVWFWILSPLVRFLLAFLWWFIISPPCCALCKPIVLVNSSAWSGTCQPAVFKFSALSCNAPCLPHDSGTDVRTNGA
jgi:hypothetical protein